MRVGIIGLGHIGYPIATHLHSLGHEVNSWTRTEKIVPWQNSTSLHLGVELEFDAIFIASGVARPNSSDSVLELATTYDLISKFVLTNRTRLFYLSSGAIYGECETPQSETDKPKPSTDYGKVKLSTENRLADRFGDRLSILRVGNIIDEENPYGIVAHLASSIRMRVIHVLGEPTDCRDYLGISDFLYCIEQLIDLKRLPKRLNIGSGTSITLNQIVTLLSDSFGDRLRTSWEPRRSGDVTQTRLNVSQMRLLFSHEPEEPLEKLKKLISALDQSNPFDR
jgi:UDP-glucose 4-epimerase